MAADQRKHFVGRARDHAQQRLARRTEDAQHLGRPDAGKRGHDIAAIAARGAGADAVGLQHDDRQPALGNRQCRRQAHDAAADHRHVGAHVVAKYRVSAGLPGGVEPERAFEGVGR
jgi:hypothetical protein